MIRATLTRILTVGLLCLGTWACTSTTPTTTDFPPPGERPDPRSSAAEAYWVFRNAVETERINAIYYLLDHTIRDAVDYGTFAAAWPKVQNDLKALFVEPTPLDPPRQLDSDPRGLDHGNPCVVIALPIDGQAAPVNTLWTLEHDPTRWRGEKAARWRLVYPCFHDGFQPIEKHALRAIDVDWPALLRATGSEGDSAGGNNADNNDNDAGENSANNAGDNHNNQSNQNSNNGLDVPPGFGG